MAPPMPEPSHEPARRSHALATLGAYAHDRDPQEPGPAYHWPYNRPLDRAALALRSCAGEASHYRLVARLSPFEHAGQTLPAAVQGELAALARALLSQARASNVLIAGHTDAAGSAHYNQRLSERRARAVSRELIRQGLPARQLQVVGYGEHAPLHRCCAARSRH
ncbi:OmpA family protein [Pseudomonas lalucatii]|nr:OmpA family protein [Pseudomonas lalucatii]